VSVARPHFVSQYLPTQGNRATDEEDVDLTLLASCNASTIVGYSCLEVQASSGQTEPGIKTRSDEALTSAARSFDRFIPSSIFKLTTQAVNLCKDHTYGEVNNLLDLSFVRVVDKRDGLIGHEYKFEFRSPRPVTLGQPTPVKKPKVADALAYQPGDRSPSPSFAEVYARLETEPRARELPTRVTTNRAELIATSGLVLGLGGSGGDCVTRSMNIDQGKGLLCSVSESRRPALGVFEL
jgi:hypothetical protein